MASPEDSLVMIDNLMSEFFSDSTSNIRKREIENILGQFSDQENAWKQCLVFFTQSKNQYIDMFCLTSLEKVINKKWVNLDSNTKNEISSSLYQILIESNMWCSVYSRNKLIKLIVDILRQSWPHMYPEFFPNILSLAQNPNTAVLCIIFMQTISEEMSNPRTDLLYERKVELHKLLVQQVPAMLSTLIGFLDTVLEKSKSAGTATPPPSPTHGGHSPDSCGLDIAATLHTSALVEGIISHIDQNSSSKPLMFMPVMDADSESIAVLTLNCITHLFTWIPLSLIPSHSLNTIFTFASLGACEQRPNKRTSSESGSSSPSSQVAASHSLGVLGMGAINEILSTNYIPCDLEDFVSGMFKNALKILHKLTKLLQSTNSDSLSPEYLEKFTEFFHLFVSRHLKMFESNPECSIMEFLELLFNYTFLQPSVELYFGCLNVWSTFLDHLTLKAEIKCKDYPLRYKEALLCLARSILMKIQFRHNQSELEKLEHDILDDSCGGENIESLIEEQLMEEGATEWQRFYSQNLEILAKIADIFPDDILTLLLPLFNDTSKLYLNLESSLNPNSLSPINFHSEHECQRLHCLLRDISSLLQAIGRFALFFRGEYLVSRSSMSFQMVRRLLDMISMSTKYKLCKMNPSMQPLQQDFVEVHAQTLSTLRSWTYWLSQMCSVERLQNDVDNKVSHHENCMAINLHMLTVAIDAISCETPLIIVGYGSQLLASLSVLVRTPVAFEMNTVQSMYSDIINSSLDQKIRHSVYRSLVNFLLLPWPNFIKDHKSELRRQHLASFLYSLTKDFLSIKLEVISQDKSLQQAQSPMILETLVMMRSQIDELNGTDKQSKQVYYQCVKDVIDQACRLFSVFINNFEICEEILSVILISVQVLRYQMGNQKVITAMHAFLDVCTANNSLTLACVESPAKSTKIIEKFLSALELLVYEVSPAFKGFIPNIISICMDYIYPKVNECAYDVRGPLYRLLFLLLENHWKYFFKPSTQTVPPRDQCANEDRFLQILQAFGQSFMEPDIGIFKYNLQYIELLNTKYKLYHKDNVKASILGHFITVLLQVLVHKTHEILQEEISAAIYNMAGVDFAAFFEAFLPHFLRSVEGLTEWQREQLKTNFKAEFDLPSFTQNICRFITDLRFYQMCNASAVKRVKKMVFSYWTQINNWTNICGQKIYNKAVLQNLSPVFIKKIYITRFCYTKLKY